MSYLKFINVFFFQWFFIRLTKCSENRIETYYPVSFDLMSTGTIGSRGTGTVKTYQWYSFQYWILPCTGWSSDFIFLSKEPKFLTLTKAKTI